MPVMVGGGGSASQRVVEQAGGHVEAHGTGTGRGARGCVGWAHARGIHERGGVCGQASGIPGRVLGVGAQQRNGILGHW